MFLLPDELFVSEAFLRTLGRAADPGGYLAYLGALRSGLSRTRLVIDLQRSAEGRGQGANAGPSVASDLWPAGRPTRRRGLTRPTDEELLALREDLFQQACLDFFGSPPSQPADHRRTAAVRELRRRTGWARSWFPALRPWAASAPARPEDMQESTIPPATPGLTALEGLAFFTIATASYMPFVRVLMDSLQRQHPHAHRLLILADEPSSPVELPGVSVVQASALGIPEFEDMTMRYDVVEFSTALKPFALRWLFEHSRLARIVYLDPDIRCEAPLTPVLMAMDDGASVVLTPHLTRPLPADGHAPDDHTILSSGSFNLGFAAFGRQREALEYLDWWSRRLRTDAVVDFQANLFTDQRWCDLAPGFLSRLAVRREPGLNVAYWNLPQRRLERSTDGHGWIVDGEPLIFFHYSGIDPDRPLAASRYQSRPLLESQPVLVELFESYAAAVRSAGWSEDRRRGWRYATEGGVRLSPTLRRLYRRRHPAPSTAGRKASVEALIAACDMEPGNGLSPLMRDLHTMRDDLRAHFDLGRAKGRAAFEGWFWSVGVVEHGLESLLRRHRATRSGRVTPGTVNAGAFP